MKRVLLPLLWMIFFQGCEEKEIYSRLLQNGPYEMPACAALKVPKEYETVISRELLKEKMVITDQCSYMLTLFLSHSACPPEKGASAGFIRIELQKEGDTFYQVQSEFEKGEEADVAALLSKKMVQELKDGSL